MGYSFSLVPGKFQMCAKVLIACLQDNIFGSLEMLSCKQAIKTFAHIWNFPGTNENEYPIPFV